jgi:hypothetical protein
MMMNPRFHGGHSVRRNELKGNTIRGKVQPVITIKKNDHSQEGEMKVSPRSERTAKAESIVMIEKDQGKGSQKMVDRSWSHLSDGD